MVARQLARLSILTLFALSSPRGDARADYLGYFPNSDESKEIDFGAGEDGAFSDGSSASGIGGAAPNFTINTDQRSVFYFSSFTLTNPNEILVTGSRPLVIYVSGNATITGAIRANGDPGGDVPSRAGGAPGAGGGSGGIGARQQGFATAESGARGSSSAAGGGAGANRPALTQQNGGGGGCYGVSGAGAEDAAGAGDDGGSGGAGAAGSCTTSRATIAAGFESEFMGGAGGGGGSANSFVGGGDFDGAGGGGAGGAIRLAVRGNLFLNGTGTLEAKGGKGGDGGMPGGASYDCGGSGGGGSGGAIWIQVGEAFSGNGPLTVEAGAKGLDPDCTNDGGIGSRGVVRIDAGQSTYAGVTSPAGIDLSYAIGRLPVVTNFTLKGGGLVCSRSLEPSPYPAIPFGRPGIFDLLLIFGAAGIAVAIQKKSSRTVKRR